MAGSRPGGSIAREDVETTCAWSTWSVFVGQRCHGADSLRGSARTVVRDCTQVIRARLQWASACAFASETGPSAGSRLTVRTDERRHRCHSGSGQRRGVLNEAGPHRAAIVGADRITANGDVANKIGTYSIACLARMHGVPFYVAAPTSTVDLSLTAPEEIPIEERPAEEVTHVAGKRVAPPGVKVLNPAFDVTPSCLVSAIITEHGVLRPPYPEALRAVCRSQAGGASRG